VTREELLLWRHIDLNDGHPVRWYQRPPVGWKAMALAAIDRSAGLCESFTGHVDADVLLHLANRHVADVGTYFSLLSYSLRQELPCILCLVKVKLFKF
jgi:hypothetical protein